MKYDDLECWVKNKAKPGDIATHYSNNGEFGEFMYTYYYTKPDDNPRWRMWSDMKKLQQWLDALSCAETAIKNLTSIDVDIDVDKYIKEINKLKVEETKMNNRCENCKYFKNVSGSFSWCSHKEHAGVLVPVFTSCADHEPKQKSEAPFDNLKFFIKDKNTGELEIKYLCEDCGKVMEAPFHWQFRVPFGPNKDPDKRPGYLYWCEYCWEKENKK